MIFGEYFACTINYPSRYDTITFILVLKTCLNNNIANFHSYPLFSDANEVMFGNSLSLTCAVEGGIPPHKVVLTRPESGGDLTWTRADGLVNFIDFH